MINETNLKRRGETWYVRVAIPRHLQDTIGRSEIVRSLHTKSRTVANKLKHSVVAEAQRLITEADRQHIKPTSHKHPAEVNALLNELRLLRLQSRQGMITDSDLDLHHELLLDKAITLRDIHSIPRDASQALSDAFGALVDTSLVTLSEAVQLYLLERQPHITTQTYNSKTHRLKMLTDTVGSDTDVRSVSRKMAGKFVSDSLVRRNLAIKTQKDVLSDLSAFFSWLEVRGIVDNNPFWRMSGTIRASTRGTTGGTTRRPWTVAELQPFLVAVDPTSTHWHAFTIALYSGMRLNEITELQLTNTSTDTFRITAGKSRAALREVPVHPLLVELVEYLQSVSTDGYLLSGLLRGGEDNKRGHYLSKSFGNLKRRLGLPAGVVFHSLRANFMTALESAGVPLSTIQLIVGHERAALAYKTYSSGVPLEQLTEGVAKVTYGEAIDTMVADRIQTLQPT